MSILVVRSSAAVASGFSTDFTGTENPLSEGGAWTRGDSLSTDLRKTGGKCFGTLDGVSGFNDSNEHITPATWGLTNDVIAKVTIYRDAGINAGLNHEMELLFRASHPTSSQTQQYEVLLNHGGGVVFVKWLGPHGFSDFSDLGYTSGAGSLGRGPVTGEQYIVRCRTVTGNVELTAWILEAGNGTPTLIGQTLDTSSPYLTGKVGFGSYISDAGANPAHWCASHYEVANYP